MTSNLSRLLEGKLVTAGELNEGDVVEVTRKASRGSGTVIYQTELFRVGSSLVDAFDRFVVQYGSVHHSINSIKMVTKNVVHNFYKNADRAPVVGDIYLTRLGSVYLVGRETKGGDSYGFSIDQQAVSWCLENDIRPDPPTRTLVWDSIRKVVVN